MERGDMEIEMTVWESPRRGMVRHENRDVATPEGWILVPSGDPALTRRLKAGKQYWQLVHRRKNRLESLGLFAPEASVRAIRAELETERADPAYLRKLASARRSREQEQQLYQGEFEAAVLAFLAFHTRYEGMAKTLAGAVTCHAVPVGSGTVARTERIPLAERAEAAVIAWLRHQTTLYDQMSIARIKGERREVRRKLAIQSRMLLDRYRRGEEPAVGCPLAAALAAAKQGGVS